MDEITSNTVSRPSDPTLADTTERVVKTFAIAAERACAHLGDPTNFPMPDDNAAIEYTFLRRLQAMPLERRNEAVQKGLTSANASFETRRARYAELAKVDLRSKLDTATQAISLSLPIAPSALKALVDGETPNVISKDAARLPEVEVKQAHLNAPLNGLAFRVSRVLCLDGTDWETGDDEIAMGGVSIDATGATFQIPETFVGEGFHDGVDRVYSPPISLARFNVNVGGGGSVNYAGIWAKGAISPRKSRSDMTCEQYEKNVVVLGGAGYRLLRVTGFAEGERDHYAAIWEKATGSQVAEKHAMTGAEYQKAFDDYAKQGYRLTQICGYGVAGQPLYAAIWEKSKGPAYYAHHGLNRAQFQDRIDQYGKEGFYLVQVSGYSCDVIGRGTSELFAGIWQKVERPEAHIAMTARELADNARRFAANGYVLSDISGYSLGEQTMYAAIWRHKIQGAEMVVAHRDMSGAEFQTTFDALVSKGYQLICSDAYTARRGFPKTFFVTLDLAQKNSDGFGQFLVDLLEKVRGEIISALTTLVGTTLGTAALPGIGTVIGAAVGWGVGEIIGLLKDIFGDWVFTPFTVSATVPSLNARWAGNTPSSPQGMIEYRGYGGKYQVTFDWALVP